MTKHPSEWKRFDVKAPPRQQNLILWPVTWIVSKFFAWRHKAKLRKVRMEGLKPPYLLLSNHNCFYDYAMMTLALMPHRPNYIVSVDGFHGFTTILKLLGGIGKRKFTNDIYLIRQLLRVKQRGDVIVLYPEARYSLIGTRALIPEAVGKLAKLLKIPVVTLNQTGHHQTQPFWNQKDRFIPVGEAVATQLYTAEELKKLSVAQINQGIREALEYDDFKWQQENKIVIDLPNRAEGLHHVLYQCPNCLSEYTTRSKGALIYCEHCHKEWELTDIGELRALEGETEFSHPPHWYEWQRANVRKEVEEGTYRLETPVIIDALPDSKKFIPLGEGWLVHSEEGFRMTWTYLEEEYVLERKVNEMYSCHIEIDFHVRNMNCIDLSTLEDTYFVYPLSEQASITKISLATEELYKYYVGNVETGEKSPYALQHKA